MTRVSRAAKPCLAGQLTIFRWPPTQAKLFFIGQWQKQNYFSLANGKNKAIFHWPMAKTKLFPVGRRPFIYLAPAATTTQSGEVLHPLVGLHLLLVGQNQPMGAGGP